MFAVRSGRTAGARYLMNIAFLSVLKGRSIGGLPSTLLMERVTISGLAKSKFKTCEPAFNRITATITSGRTPLVREGTLESVSFVTIGAGTTFMSAHIAP